MAWVFITDAKKRARDCTTNLLSDFEESVFSLGPASAYHSRIADVKSQTRFRSIGWGSIFCHTRKGTLQYHPQGFDLLDFSGLLLSDWTLPVLRHLYIYMEYLRRGSSTSSITHRIGSGCALGQSQTLKYSRNCRTDTSRSQHPYDYCNNARSSPYQMPLQCFTNSSTLKIHTGVSAFQFPRSPEISHIANLRKVAMVYSKPGVQA